MDTTHPRPAAGARIVAVLTVAAAAAFCLHVFSDNKADVDLWGNVRFVKVPPWRDGFDRVNTYSFTEPDRPWINHEWLAQYVFHHVFTRFGNPGLLAFKLAMGAAVALLLYAEMKRSCRSGPLRFLWLLLVVSTIGYGFSTRPHHYSYLMLALMLTAIRRGWAGRPAGLVLAPLAGALWANLHGSFILGAAVLGLLSGVEFLRWLFPGGAGRDGKRLGLTWLATALYVAATLANPHGPKVWFLLYDYATVPRPYLSEWAPFSLRANGLDHPDFLVLSVLSLAGVLLSRRRKDLFGLGVLAAFFAGGWMLRRNIPLFAIVSCFVVPEHLDALAGGFLERLRARIPAAALAAALLAFAGLSLRNAYAFHKTDPFQIEVSQDLYPVQMVEFMKLNGIRGNALIFFDWAEYCLWHLYPGVRPFVDGRFNDCYSFTTLNEFFSFLYGWDDPDAALRDHPVDIVLIHNGNPACERMLARADWQLAGRNNLASLFLKKDIHRDFLERLEKKDVEYPPDVSEVFFP